MTTYQHTYHLSDAEFVIVQQALLHYLGYCKRELNIEPLSSNALMVERLEALLERGPNERRQMSGYWAGAPLADDEA